MRIPDTTSRAAALCALGALISLFTAAAIAQSPDEISVPLSDPGSPIELEVALVRGSIAVSAHEAPEIHITVDTGVDEEPPAARSDGLRPIRNTSYDLTVTEIDNRVSVSTGPMQRIDRLVVRVPRNTSVKATTVQGDSVRIEGVSGEHELSNTNGDIAAIAIGGSLVANTTNGDVEVSFTDITPEKAMSFSSFNGDVDVSFPRDLRANLRISSGRGEILTEFEVDVGPQTPSVDRSEDSGRYRVRVEREIRATVGGGGPEMYFKTFNGDIVIRDNIDD